MKRCYNKHMSMCTHGYVYMYMCAWILRLQNSCLECCLPPWLIAAGLDLLTIPGGVSSQAQTCSRAGGRKLGSPWPALARVEPGREEVSTTQKDRLRGLETEPLCFTLQAMLPGGLSCLVVKSWDPILCNAIICIETPLYPQVYSISSSCQ